MTLRVSCSGVWVTYQCHPQYHKICVGMISNIIVIILLLYMFMDVTINKYNYIYDSII